MRESLWWLVERVRKHSDALLLNLFWPAAAGNVGWSTYKVLLEIDGFPPDSTVVARLFLLVLLAIYLAVNWVRMAEVKHAYKLLWFVGDVTHLSTIVLLAIATEDATGAQVVDPETLLVLLFSLVIVWHICGVWIKSKTVMSPGEDGNQEPGEQKYRIRFRETIGSRLTLIVPSAVGIALVYVIPLQSWYVQGWNLPLALLVMLVVWGYIRKKLTDY